MKEGFRICELCQMEIISNEEMSFLANGCCSKECFRTYVINEAIAMLEKAINSLDKNY